MVNVKQSLVREWMKNTLIAVIVYGIFLATMVFTVDITFDLAFYLGIFSSIFGTSYILTIRNPKNYLGFIFGVSSSFLLGIKLWLLGTYDQSVLYFIVFIPFQLRSYFNWRTSTLSKGDDAPLVLKFLPLKKMLSFVAIGALIMMVDYYVLSTWLMPNASTFMQLLCGFIVATAVLANFLLINRWVDCWIYWVVFSTASIVYAVMMHLPFTIMLFIFFLVINGITCVDWIKMWYQQQKK